MERWRKCVGPCKTGMVWGTVTFFRGFRYVALLSELGGESALSVLRWVSNACFLSSGCLTPLNRHGFYRLLRPYRGSGFGGSRRALLEVPSVC
jgi:hypothetical protein